MNDRSKLKVGAFVRLLSFRREGALEKEAPDIMSGHDLLVPTNNNTNNKKIRQQECSIRSSVIV